MSTRFGMADGRCLTTNVSTRLFNDELITKANIETSDNRAYRAHLQSMEEIPLPFCSLVKYSDLDTNK